MVRFVRRPSRWSNERTAPPNKTPDTKKAAIPMSFARFRAQLHNSSDRRRLYDRINRVAADSQRDELLIMAQRAEQRTH